MAAKGESKDSFIDHSLNFFKGRVKGTAEGKRLKKQSKDPYGHVVYGSKATTAPARDYSRAPDESDLEDSSSHILAAPLVETGSDAGLSEIYATLREQGGAYFGAQRSDGSWEVQGPISPSVAITAHRGQAADSKKTPGQLDPEVENILAEGLKSFSHRN